MRRIIVVLAAMAAMVVVYAGAAWAASVPEGEPNDSRDQAQNIDGSSFSLDSDPNIGDKFVNTSTIIPHATINGTGSGTGENLTVDWYSFTVSQAGDGVILDVDDASFDSDVFLFDSSGQLLAELSDSQTDWGQGGSTWDLDSYLEYTFQTPGTYYVAVGSCCGGVEPNPIGDGMGIGGTPHYQLQVSLGELFYYCNDQAPTIQAQPGRPVKGTKGDDVIAGTQGPDTINGNGGNDTICGKGGNDTISGGDGDDSIFGEGGNGAGGNGAGGNDSISGGAGNDFLSGGDGDDSISGGDGDDRIGNDAGYGDDSISGGAGNDYISDGEGNDRIKGDQGSDYLEGVFGDDTIDGGPGPDYIDGGPGHDWCSIGEIGRDSCEFGPSVKP
jgi:Ca2+-binding RTX toxin-like protein